MPSGEDRLIGRFFRPLARDPGSFDLRDDAAAITPPAGHDLVLTTDAVIEGVHFFPDDPATDIARKALRANLSDLAAKGAAPLGFLLTLALPKSVDEEWVAAFADGLAADIDAYKCPLLGGDTDSTPGLLSVAISAFGSVPHGKMVRRAGAKAGDVIVVTGTLGDSALGLMLRQDPQLAARAKLTAEEEAYLQERYLLPRPRSILAGLLREHAHAAMDISDGLAGDAAKLAAASNVAMEINSTALPLSSAGRKLVAFDPALIETVCTGGDDYELLGAIPATNVEGFQRQAIESGVPVTVIGSVETGEGTAILDAKGKSLAFRQASFSHF
ncbi:MAG TPA: thiamine-phosphate kinase [Xanthobacteraceae bacterium]|jgi:thiamine-monophosphate kinase|nr:thiamine-phosphate kinase [Xanthobacteraceae bacterium]